MTASLAFRSAKSLILTAVVLLSACKTTIDSPGSSSPTTVSGLAASDASLLYLNKTGDTMSGTLNLAADGLKIGNSQLITAGGNVGIGTATPLSTLTFRKGIEIASQANSFTPTLLLRSTDPTSNNAQVVYGGPAGNNWAIGTDVGAGNGSRDFHFFDFAGAAGVRMSLQSSTGYVGIGTSAPSFKLEIGGTSSISDRTIGINATPVVYLPDQGSAVGQLNGSLAVGNGLRLLSNTTSNEGRNNTSVGINASVANTTGPHNTAVGYSALNANTTGSGNSAYGSLALKINTAGSFNTASGLESLMFNTVGGSNSAYGYLTLWQNTTGGNNVAVGANSLQNNSAGSNNTAVGVNSLQYNQNANSNTSIGGNSLYYNTSGSNNVAVGQSAGMYIPGLIPNYTSDNSIYIGPSTKGLADGDTNEIVIGSGASGNGSNSVTLGNSSVSKTILTGNVGIGTTNPQTALDVNGVIRVAKYAAQPFACDAAHDSSISITSGYRQCICKGGTATWVFTSDGSTTCTW